MSTSMREIQGESERSVMGAWRAARKDTWWWQRREAGLNWLALGVLLAAWNASDNGASTAPVSRRPQSLRGYSAVSVRAATLHSAGLRNSPSTS